MCRPSGKMHRCWHLEVCYTKWLESLLAVGNLSKGLQRVWESELWKNNWVAVINRGESFQQNLLNSRDGREETFSQTFLVDHIKQLSIQTFRGSVWKSWRKVPIVEVFLSSQEKENYPTTSLDENCIEREFLTDRNYYSNLRQSFLTFKLQFVKGPGYDTYQGREKKNEHKHESVVFTETGTDDEEEIARVTFVNNILHSMFSDVEVYINKQFQIYNSNGL